MRRETIPRSIFGLYANKLALSKFRDWGNFLALGHGLVDQLILLCNSGRDAGPVRPTKEESDTDAAHSGEHAAPNGHRQAPSQGAAQTHERSP